MPKPKQSGTYYERNREKVLEKARANRAKARSTEKLNDARRRARGGSFTSAEWEALLDQVGNCCARCRRALPLSPDHITPVSKGGTALIDNIQPLCDDCNRWKGNRVIRNFLLEPLEADEVAQLQENYRRGIKGEAPVPEAAQTERGMPPTPKRGLSLGYLDWLDRYGFYVKESFSPAENNWTGEGQLLLLDHQRDIMAEMLRLNEAGELVYEDGLYSCVMKSGKTAIAASVVAWYAECSAKGVEIYVLANSQEQAEGRVMRDVKYHAKQAWPDATVNEYEITLINGTTISAVTKSAKSGAGTRRSLTVYDELWGYTTESDRRMWSEFTPISTVVNPFRLVVTYAGFEDESDLLWEHYQRGVGKDEHDEGRGQPIARLWEDGLPCWANGRMFTYWDHEPRMPWQTQTYYDARMDDERPADYLRHHENRWVTSTEAFLDPTWWAEAETKFPAGIDIYAEHPYRAYPVWIGVDVAPKHDSSAVVGVTYDGARAKVILLFARIWTPVPGELFDMEATVEKYILNMARSVKTMGVFYDPAQFHRSMVTLVNRGIPMFEFTQTETNMISASQNLFDLLRTKALEAYPHPDLARHLKSAIAKTTGRGHRIVKTEKQRSVNKYKTQISRRNIDGAIALAMAAYQAINQGGLETRAPIVWEVPFSDASAWKGNRNPVEALLPFPLRS